MRTSLVHSFEKKDGFVKTFIGDFSAENEKKRNPRQRFGPIQADSPETLLSATEPCPTHTARPVNIFTEQMQR